MGKLIKDPFCSHSKNCDYSYNKLGITLKPTPKCFEDVANRQFFQYLKYSDIWTSLDISDISKFWNSFPIWDSYWF